MFFAIVDNPRKDQNRYNLSSQLLNEQECNRINKRIIIQNTFRENVENMSVYYESTIVKNGNITIMIVYIGILYVMMNVITIASYSACLKKALIAKFGLCGIMVIMTTSASKTSNTYNANA